MILLIYFAEEEEVEFTVEFDAAKGKTTARDVTGNFYIYWTMYSYGSSS